MSDSAAGSAYRIQHLFGVDNYSTWKIKMLDILTDMDLVEYALGTLTKPTDTSKAAVWTKKDRQALSAIRLRVSDDSLVYISDAETSNSAWTTLADMYQPKGPIGIVTARRKLFRAQCQDGEDISEHIKTMTRYRKELASLNSKLTDDEFSITLLTSLPDSWDNFIQGIDTSSLSDSNKLIARILEQSMRKDAKPSSDDVALTVSKHHRKRYCFRCGKKGHFIHNCPHPPDDPSDSSESNSSDRDHTHVVYDDDYAF